MAEHPNLEAARSGYAAFGRGDMEAVGAVLADDIVWHSGGNNVLTGDYEGKEAVFGFFARLMQDSGGSFKNEIHDLLANDDHGVALVTSSATRDGKSIEFRAAHIFHMRDGKMTEFWSFAESQSDLDEFWS